MKLYLILVGGDYIRDSQIYTGKNIDGDIYDDDSTWKDFCPTHVVGVVYASTYENSIKRFLELCSDYEEFMLSAYEISDEVIL